MRYTSYIRSRLDEITRPDSYKKAGRLLWNAGYSLLGTGSFAQAFVKQGEPWVIKLFDSEDAAYLTFCEFARQNPNKHFPRFKGKPFRIADTYYGVRTELLKERMFNTLWIYDYITYDESKYKLPDQQGLAEIMARRYQNAVMDMEDYPELKIACDGIKQILTQNPGFRLDFGDGNVLFRNGTLVFSDPIV